MQTRKRKQTCESENETHKISKTGGGLKVRDPNAPIAEQKQKAKQNSSSVRQQTSTSSSMQEEGPLFGEDVWVRAGSNCPRGRHVNPIPKDLEDIDLRHPKDPAYCKVYVKDIYSYLSSLQFKYQINHNFLADMQAQRNRANGSCIREVHRAVLIDWLVEVAEDHMLLSDTLYLCVAYIDRVLSELTIHRSDLQLLGCACLLVAAKYEEQFSPRVDELVAVTDNSYTKKQILHMEFKVLAVLKYQLTMPTAKTFSRRFQRSARVKTTEKFLCDFFTELCLLEYDLIVCPPDHIAAACLLAARITLYSEDSKNFPSFGGNQECIYPLELEHYSGFSQVYLDAIVKRVLHLHQNASHSRLESVVKKYQDQQYGQVSEIIHPYPLSGINARAEPDKGTFFELGFK